MDDSQIRCPWANQNLELQHYHDFEWGKPLKDDQQLFALLSLELMQAGLSWSIVLKKRVAMRQAFYNFDIQQVAHLTEKDQEQILMNPKVIRNRLKVGAIIKNAQAILKIQEQGTFSDYIWQFVNQQPVINHWSSENDVPSQTTCSQKMSQQMKKDGFAFVGPTTIYSFMQAAGLVFDHISDCFVQPTNVSK